LPKEFGRLSRARKRFAFPQLPEDVIEVVLDHLSPDIPFSSPKFSWNGRDADAGYTKRYIASLGLISRAWINPSRRILYRTITPSYCTPRNSPLLWTTIATYSHVRKYVRRIHLIRLLPDLYIPPLPLSDDFRDLLPRCTVLIPIPEPLFTNAPQMVIVSDLIGFLVIGLDSLDSYSTEMWRTGFRSWTRLQAMQIQGTPLWFPSNYSEGDDDTYLPSLRILRLSWTLQDHVPIPPTTPNTIHTLCISNCPTFSEVAFLNLIHRHSASLRRLYIANTYFVTDSATSCHPLMTALSHLQNFKLESLIIHDMGASLSEDSLLHLPPSLIEVSLACHASAPIPFTAFQTFLQARGGNTTPRDIEIILKRVDFAAPAIDKRWSAFARRNKQPGLRVIFLKSGAQLSLPNWACMDDTAF
jgi:hypothetical protein